jgi:hypothetical protein
MTNRRIEERATLFERFVTSPLFLVGYVRWDARSDQSSFVKRSLQQLSGRNPTTRLLARNNFRLARDSGPVPKAVAERLCRRHCHE